jgi:hypothetical protein
LRKKVVKVDIEDVFGLLDIACDGCDIKEHKGELSEEEREIKSECPVIGFCDKYGFAAPCE